MAALSRTLRVRTCTTVAPRHISPSIGRVGVRPRVGLSPKTPQHDAGIRIEPPPTPPPASGTIPLATAAPDPPDEPPTVTSGFHGFRQMPNYSDSVHGTRPNSGVFVLPTTIRPARLYRRTISESTGGLQSLNSRLPHVSGSPAYHETTSFSRKGTPWNGPSGIAPFASSSARSNMRWTTALSRELTASIRLIAAITASRGEISFRRISSATPSPSCSWKSIIGYLERARSKLARCGQFGDEVPASRGSR